MNFSVAPSKLRKLSLFALLFPAFLSISFAQSEKTVKTTVQRATVFLQGAQLSSTETVSVQSGITNIIFEGVSPYLTESSLQAVGKGGTDFVIMDVRYNLKYVEAAPKKTTIAGAADPNRERYERDLQTVNDSLVELGFIQQSITYQKNNLTVERNVMTTTKMMRGEFKRDSLPLLTQSIDFLRMRLNNIDTENLKLEREQYRLTLIVNRLNTKRAELQQLIAGNYPKNPVVDAAPKPVSQVIVTVQSDMPTVAQVNLSYFVPNAGWSVSYDLRASKDLPTIDLRHKASVYQNTGVDWKDVLLTLSTGNPSASNVKPVLSPYFINYEQPIVYQNYNQNALRNQNVMPTSAARAGMKMTEAEDAKKEYAPPRDASDFVTVSEGMLRVEYEIKLRYTIESDNKPHNVSIQNKTIPAIYNYSVIPKIDLDPFLIARLTGWEDMNLIQGQARIYFDGSFIGETTINPKNTNDTLQLNLGRDKSIAVTRVKVKDRSKERILSDMKVVTKTYEIKIRNTKSTPIRLVVEDQLPVTQDASIKIEKLEDSNATTFNAETGKLTWDFRLSSRDTKTLIFSYEVRYPKEKVLNNL